MNEDFIDLIDRRVKQHKDGIYTSIPASVLEYDKDANEVKLKLEVELLDSDNAPLIACKVHFPGDSDYVVVHAIKEGSQGMAMFSCRAINKYIETGDTQSSKHQFSQNDVWFIPGINSDDKAIKNAPAEGLRLQNRIGTEYVWLKPGGLEINVPVTFAAPVTMSQGFDAKSKATLDGENLTKVSHTHPFTNADGVPSNTQGAKE